MLKLAIQAKHNQHLNQADTILAQQLAQQLMQQNQIHILETVTIAICARISLWTTIFQ